MKSMNTLTAEEKDLQLKSSGHVGSGELTTISWYLENDKKKTNETSSMSGLTFTMQNN